MTELSTLGNVIKAAYEGVPNTNVFTDAEKAKLGDISQAAMDILSEGFDGGIVSLES